MEVVMKNFAVAVVALHLLAPGASWAADNISRPLPAQAGFFASDPAPITPQCGDIQFVSVCLPLDCDKHVDENKKDETLSLTRYAYCPTLHECPIGIDLVAKTRTCDASGCGNHALGFLACGIR
jgi:hypothetical protein